MRPETVYDLIRLTQELADILGISLEEVLGDGQESNHQGKQAFAQSTSITAAWNWFMILAGKAAEPVLVASVLYASVKMLPVVHFSPQFDVVVFIAQFVALDIGGLSLNKGADQAKKDGNDNGAKHARRLSIALVGVMLIGVIMAGVDQIIKIEGQVGTVINTILLIARAVMAVLYSRVIHSLKKDDEPGYCQLIPNPIDPGSLNTSLLLLKKGQGDPEKISTVYAKTRSFLEKGCHNETRRRSYVGEGKGACSLQKKILNNWHANLKARNG